MIKNIFIFSLGFFIGTGIFLVVQAQELEQEIQLDEIITTVDSPIKKKLEPLNFEKNKEESKKLNKHKNK